MEKLNENWEYLFRKVLETYDLDTWNRDYIIDFIKDRINEAEQRGREQERKRIFEAIENYESIKFIK